jgi:hypothetical protein
MCARPASVALPLELNPPVAGAHRAVFNIVLSYTDGHQDIFDAIYYGHPTEKEFVAGVLYLLERDEAARLAHISLWQAAEVKQDQLEWVFSREGLFIFGKNAHTSSTDAILWDAFRWGIIHSLGHIIPS